MAYASFDIGGTSIKPGVVTETGEILAKLPAFQTADTRDANMSQLIADIQQMQAHHSIEGIGISIPGVVTSNGFLITAGAIKSMYQFDLANALTEATHLPVHVENDANAAAIAEHWLGAARNSDNYLCLVLGTGIGGGLVLNGEIYRGAHGMAGEIGWNVTRSIDYTQPLETASLNQTASVVTGLVARYNQVVAQANPNQPAITDAREIITAAHAGEPLAVRVYQDFKESVAVMLLNVVGTFDPELVLIGGGISANPTFMADIQQTTQDLRRRHESLHGIAALLPCTFAAAQLHNDAGLIGAAYGIHHQLNRQ